MRPGKWVVSIEVDAAALGRLLPTTIIRCLSAEDFKGLALPANFFDVIRGCDLVDHRFDGSVNFFRLGCPGGLTAELELRYAAESFVLGAKVAGPGLSLKFKGTGKRAGACATVDDTEALLVAARAYATVESGVAIVFVQGTAEASEMLAAWNAKNSQTVLPGTALLAVVDFLAKQEVKAKPFVAQLERSESEVYYILNEETLGPWSFDQATCILPLILKLRLAKSAAAAAAEKRLLELIARTSMVGKGLVSMYEEQSKQKVDRKDTLAVERAVTIATYTLAARELASSVVVKKPDPKRCTSACRQDGHCSDRYCVETTTFRDEPVEKVLRDHEKKTGTVVDRRDPLQVAEALTAIYEIK